MAHEEISYELEEVSHDIGLNSITMGFALLAGAGVTLMIVALGIGVIQGTAADGGLIGLLFGGGLLALLAGAIAWYGVVRPDTHFDDINVPLDTGHGHGHDEHADEHALVPVDAAVEVDAHGHPVNLGTHAPTH